MVSGNILERLAHLVSHKPLTALVLFAIVGFFAWIAYLVLSPIFDRLRTPTAGGRGSAAPSTPVGRMSPGRDVTPTKDVKSPLNIFNNMDPFQIKEARKAELLASARKRFLTLHPDCDPKAQAVASPSQEKKQV